MNYRIEDCIEDYEIEINRNFFPFTTKRKGETMKELFNAISDEVSKYLDVDQLIQLSLTSTIPLFRGLNNLKFKRYIPPSKTIDNKAVFKFFYSQDPDYSQFNGILRSIKDKDTCLDFNEVDSNNSGCTLLLGSLFFEGERRGKAIIDALIYSGSNINKRNRYGTTALKLAVRRNNLDAVKSLLKAGALIEDPGQQECAMPLNDAIRNGNIDIVNAIIESDQYVNNRDNKGNTYLHQAIKNNNVDIINLFIPMNINVRNNDGNTPLHIIIDDTPFYKMTDNTSLYIRYIAKKSKNIKALISYDGPEILDINIPNNHGETPLHRAVALNNLEIVNMLINVGQLNINVQNDEGHTPLYKAVLNKNVEIVKALVDHGADINIPANYGGTPLHRAVNVNNVEIFKILINVDEAAINTKNYKRMSPLDLARRLNRETILKLLK